MNKKDKALANALASCVNTTSALMNNDFGVTRDVPIIASGDTVQCPVCGCPKTNNDCLNATTPEEKAKILLQADFCLVCDHHKDGLCFFCEQHPDEPLYNGCFPAAVKWLKQEAAV